MFGPGATLNKKLASLQLHLYISRYDLRTQHPQYLVLIILLKPPHLGARKIFFENRMLYILFWVPIEKSIIQTLILFYWFDDCPYTDINLQLSFFAFKLHTKKLGGAVVSWLISYNVVTLCRLCIGSAKPYLDVKYTLVREWPTFIDV